RLLIWHHRPQLSFQGCHYDLAPNCMYGRQIENLKSIIVNHQSTIPRSFSKASNNTVGFPSLNTPLGPVAFSIVTRAAPLSDAIHRRVHSAAKRVCCLGSTASPRAASVSGEMKMGLSVKLRTVAMMSGPV